MKRESFIKSVLFVGLILGGLTLLASCGNHNRIKTTEGETKVECKEDSEAEDFICYEDYKELICENNLQKCIVYKGHLECINKL